jgi:AhpD family alkylhydroperoxidase
MALRFPIAAHSRSWRNTERGHRLVLRRADGDVRADGKTRVLEPASGFPRPQPSSQRKAFAPEIHDAFEAFSRKVFAAGALPSKTKQLIAVAVAHVTQCPYCIRGHTKAARAAGAMPQEIMEAVWVAAEMRAGGAYAHAVISINALESSQSPPSSA